MALFPAFAQSSSVRIEDSTKEELDWLNNKSFQSGDALSLHTRFLKDRSEERKGSSAEEQGHEEEDKKSGDEHDSRKRKKKKRKKKRKHKRKNAGRYSESSGSESDTVYPSDLKKEQEAQRCKSSPLANHFSWLDDLQTTPKNPYCVDHKPDPANWTYKSLYRGDVTRYKRKGSSALGLHPQKEGISWDESTSSKKKQKGGDKKKTTERYYSAASRQLLRSETALLLSPKLPDDENGFSNTSFLPLCHAKLENLGGLDGTTIQRSLVNPLGVYDPSTALWLQGKGRQEEVQQQSQQDMLDTEVNPSVRRTEEFNRQLREQPTDTQLWMRFISYQDELSLAGEFGAQEKQRDCLAAEHRKSYHRGVLEKKLSIAERAVESNPGCIALQLERLRICQELWEPSALVKEWKKLVFVHPNSAPLWREYLLFNQSYFSSFTFSKVNAAYGKCLSTLSSVQDGSMVSHPPLPRTENHMLDIFIQQCHFLRQAGHSEKALSLFQAMIDFTFFKPDNVRELTTKQQVEFFEPFWDSGEARVGELGARGWKAWMLQQERGGWIPPSTEEEEEEDEEMEEVKDPSQPRAEVWLHVESSREAAHWLPWRPDKAKGQSEEDCEDPDRQVLFDDIGPSLIRLSSADLQLRLLLYFLSFLGLPVDLVLCPAPCQCDFLLENLSFLTQGNDQQRPLTTHDLTDPGVNSLGHMTSLQMTRRHVGLGKQGEKFLTSVLNMLLPMLPPHHRAALCLSRMQYEKLKVIHYLQSGNKKRLRSQGKRSKQVCKGLLKEPENRTSLVLWREYAHLEWLLGNTDEAHKVFMTAVGSGVPRGLSCPALNDLCLLWAQLELENKGPPADTTTSASVTVLTQLAEAPASGSHLQSSQGPSPVSVLKARKLYEQTLLARFSAVEQALANGKGEQDWSGEHLSFSGLVGCYALFQYLTVGVQGAIAVFDKAREWMEALHHKNTDSNLEGDGRSPGSQSRLSDWLTHAERLSFRRLAAESHALAIQQANLLRYHSSIGRLPLATLRQKLNSALSTWPSCTTLWMMYIQVENRSHSAGRARRFFDSVSRGNSNMVPRLFAIVVEQRRKQLVDAAQRSHGSSETLPVLPENGLGHRICALFENAVATPTGAHCPLLWRMYMHFLFSEGKVEKAEGIFYKALQNVPWVKGLYLDAVKLFPEHLQQCVDMITEKELRLRLPLEELDILLED